MPTTITIPDGWRVGDFTMHGPDEVTVYRSCPSGAFRVMNKDNKPLVDMWGKLRESPTPEAAVAALEAQEKKDE